MLPLELQVLEEEGSTWFLRDLLPLTFWESRSGSPGGGTPPNSPEAICALCALRMEHQVPSLSLAGSTYDPF